MNESDTTLQSQFGLTDEQVHEIVQRGLLGVGELNLRMERMETYSTLSGFQQDEVPLMDAKLEFLARQLDPQTQEERLERVVDLVGLPEVDPNPDVRDVDLGRLIEITADPEVVAFRNWVRTVDHLDDDEVADQIHRIRDMLGEAVRTKAGKVVRFGVTTGIGVVVPPAGIVLGALDTFATEKLLRGPGPTAFLSRLYPSVFTSTDAG